MWRLAILLALSGACGDDAATPSDASVDDGAPDTASATLAIDPIQYDYGDREIGTAAIASTFLVRNTGGAPIAIDSVSIDGDDFMLGPNKCVGVLEPGLPCEVSVSFEPTRTTSRSATLQVTAGGNTATSLLSGRGTSGAQRLVIQPSAHDMGDLPVGQTSPPFAFHVLNLTGAATPIAPVLTGASADSYAIESTTCNGSIPAGESCTVSVTFTPPHGGELVAELKVTDAANRSYRGGLLGHSTTPLKMSPYERAFESVLIGQPAPNDRITFTVENTTPELPDGITTGALVATLVGLDAGHGTIRTTTCTTLAPMQTCSVTVEFTPTTRGNKRIQLDVTDSASGKGVRTTAIGSAYTFLIVGPMSFGDVQTSQTKKVTFDILNPSDRSTGTPNVTLAGADANQFALSNSTCTAAIPAHAKCTVDVTFAPTTNGAKTVDLRVTGNPGSSDLQVLTGRGI